MGCVLLAAVVLSGFLFPARAQYFGQNKVQYRTFDWQVLESEHFDLYFYEAERKVAVDAARMAERAYQRLSLAMDHKFDDKIPLIIYASHTDFQSTNVSPGQIHEGTEGITELMKRRVFLPFTGSYSEFQHVLEHELVHAFQLDIMLGRAENSLTNPLSYTPPLWVMEGMAEYYSSGDIDSHTAMWLRDAALQGYLVSLEDLTYVGDIRVYRFGQAIMSYIAQRFGEKKVAAIYKDAIQHRSYPRALEETLGLGLKRLSEDWTQHVRRTYLPQIADHLKPDEFARPLTDGSDDLASFNLAVSVDPSGDRFVFISDRSLYNDLYLASAIDGKVARRLVKGERTGDFESLRFFRTAISWSPDGRFLALPARDNGEDVIVIYDVDRGREEGRLRVDLDGVLSPSWSPDGQRIVFTGIRDGHPDLYVVNRDGAGLERLTHSKYAAKDPQWSPDGRWIAFTTDMGAGTDFAQLVFGDYRIGLFDFDTGEIHIPEGQTGKCVNPQWSPDGSQILFVSDRTGISNIYVMDVEGGNVRQLTNILTGVTGLIPSAPSISMSRDGSRLLFTAFSRGGFEVYAMDYPLGIPEGDEGMPAPEAWIVNAFGIPSSAGEIVDVDPKGLATSSLAPEAQIAQVAEGSAPGSEGQEDRSLLTRPGTPGVGEEGAEASDSTGASGGITEDAAPGLASAPAGTRADSVGTAPGREEAPGVAATGAGTDPGPDAVPGGATTLERDSGATEPAMPGETSTAGETSTPSSAIGLPRDPAREEGEEMVVPSLPDSSTFSFRDYRLRFSPDFVAANGLFASNIGLAAQTAIGFSDVLGNHQFVIGASVYGSLLDADIFLSYANLSRRTNWGISLFQYRSDFVVSVPDEEEGDDEYISQILRGVEFAVSRPFNRFQRAEIGLELVGIEEREFGSTLLSSSGPTTYIDVPGDAGHRFFVRPRGAVVFDNIVYGSTGPISGRRWRFELDRAFGGVDFTTFLGDFRRYFNIRQRYVLAFRGVGATSFGANEQAFRIGGPYTLRAYDFADVTGSSVLLTNLEFRYPLIDVVKLGWPLPITLAGIRGLIFLDAGAAWTDASRFKPIGGQPDRSGFYLNDIKAAWGFGARMNVLGFLVARWDLARRTDLRSNTGPWVGRFSLGAEF